MEISTAEIVDRFILTSRRFAFANLRFAKACRPKLGTTFLTALGLNIALILNRDIIARLQLEVVQAFALALH